MSSGQLDPINNPTVWDVVNVGGVQSSGLARVSEFKRKAAFDEKKGKGVQGSTITYTGRPAAKGSIKFELWEPEHFQQWESFRPLFQYDPTKTTVTGVDIFHPSLADININAVVCEEIGNIVHEGEQLYSITVSLLEYFPPPAVSAVSTPTTAVGNASAPNATPPLTDQEQLAQVNAAIKAASP